MAADLVRKLQLKPGQQLAALHAPAGLMEGLGPQLAALAVAPGAPGATDAALVFVTRLGHAAERLAEGAALLRPGGLLWIAYPKGGSKVDTDVNRERLWQALTGTGWRPVRQVAIDAVWSGLRFRPEAEVGR